MPELPEVETVMRGLTPALVGHQFRRVQLNRPNLRFPFPADFAERVQGQRVVRLSRRAKYMLWHLGDGATVLLHLGMSGRFTFADDESLGPLGTHDHVVFQTDQGTEIRYTDPRRFGFMDLIDPGQPCRFLDGLGPEPLGNDFNAAYLQTQLAGRSAAIKTRLLDQKVVVGVGNIYCCEALFQAGIHPARPSKDVTAQEGDRLTIAIRDVLARAIAAGGSSLRDYVQADGTLGYFQHAWAVYGRQDAPCRHCQTPIQRLIQSSRSSFFCPKCQA